MKLKAFCTFNDNDNLDVNDDFEKDMHIKIKAEHKSIRNGVEFDLPNFTVLTGKNGSGKSHLLEAISTNGLAEIRDGQNVLSTIKYIRFNDLNPQFQEEISEDDVKNSWRGTWNQLNQYLQNYRRNPRGYNNSFESLIQQYDSQTQKFLQYWYELAENDVEKLTENLFYENYELSREDLFTSQIGTIFKLYQTRLDENKMNEVSNREEGTSLPVLSNEEFEQKYGRKPWEVINEMMKTAHLPYEVEAPTRFRPSINYHLQLIGRQRNIRIQVNDLSTGEKVLMSLALSIYSTEEKAARPDVLLIDEPDAPLHPEYSNYLIQAIKESIVDKSGVRVIITTHSPTTVAMAPEESIYQMSRDLSKPVKVTKQQAINLLTKDLDNMRVSIEERRQIFVESKYDVGFYNRLYKCLSANHVFTTVPFFLAAKSGEGSNCQDVKDIVNALRQHGNDLVYGVIDYDGQNHGNQYVCVVGGGKRYAIDNYIFDPIYLAFLLIRERVVTSEDMGVGKSVTFTQLHTLTHNELQTMIDYVASSLGFNDANKTSYNVLAEPDSYEVASEWFTIQGHDLEDKITQKWGKLYGIKHGHGDDYLKNYVLDNVTVEFPQFIAKEVKELFEKFE